MLSSLALVRGRRDVRAEDPEHAHHRRRRRAGPGRRAPDRRHPARREAARGAADRGRGAPLRRPRRPLRDPAAPRRAAAAAAERGTPLPDGFRYASDTNDRWLGADELLAMADALPPARRAATAGAAEPGWEAVAVRPPPASARALCVAAHPDDEILGAGATMAALADAGCEVHVLVLGEGVGARFAGDDAPRRRGRASWRASCAAPRRSSARRRTSSTCPTTASTRSTLLDVVQRVEAVSARARRPTSCSPTTPATSTSTTASPPNAVLTAFRPLPGRAPGHAARLRDAVLDGVERARQRRAVRAELVLGRDARASSARWRRWTPTGTSCASGRTRARCEGIRVAARRWGMTVGLEAAEAFALLRRVAEPRLRRQAAARSLAATSRSTSAHCARPSRACRGARGRGRAPPRRRARAAPRSSTSSQQRLAELGRRRGVEAGDAVLDVGVDARDRRSAGCRARWPRASAGRSCRGRSCTCRRARARCRTCVIAAG